MSDTFAEENQPAEIVGEPMEDPKNLLRQARELIPVTATGVSPQTFAQQIDYAQAMTKARSALPAHLRGNIGDCLAVIDIATRAGLSPYMVASKTYVQNDRLCFESQLFHAFAQSSGLLRGDLEVSYEGEGEDCVCIVVGYLRSDPNKQRVHKSPPLKDLHPGYSLKKRNGNETSKKFISYADGQKLKADGLEDGAELFSKGSPLWDRKPLVQMFYDTSRDWVRLFAPRATLGIYTPDEMDEYGPEFARDITPQSGLSERLANGNVSRDEGHKPGHVDAELAQVAPSTQQEIIAAKPAATDPEKPAKATKRKSAKADKQEPEAAAPAAEQTAVPPKNAREWATYCAAWVKAEPTYEAIRKRWDAERSLRNSCGVTSEERVPVQNFMIDRCRELGELGDE